MYDLNFIKWYKGIAGNQNVHDVPNVLYDVTNMELSAQYSQINSSDVPGGNLFRETITTLSESGAPYEVPVPLNAMKGEDD